MDRDRYQGVCPHTQDPLSQAPEHGFTIKVQVFTLVIVFYLCHGPAGNVIIINQGKAVVKASSVFCTVAAVFNGIAYDLLSAFFAGRPVHPGQFFHAVRADEISPGHDNPGADRAAAGEQEVQELSLIHISPRICWSA